MNLRYAVALIVVVDMLAAIVQMQQAIIERATFQPPSVTTYAQYAVTMTAKTADDIDLYVRDPAGNVAWYAGLQSGPLSLLHDTIPGVTDPVSVGEKELAVVRESQAGEYVANVMFYAGSDPVTVTVSVWDLRGLNKRVVYSRSVRLTFEGEQRTAFRWMLDSRGDYTGHNLLPANLLRNGVGQ